MYAIEFKLVATPRCYTILLALNTIGEIEAKRLKEEFWRKKKHESST
jgi:hypothetical protein